MQRIKWFIPMMAAMLFVAVVVPGTSEGGSKWSGADPMLTVNGEQFNVRFEWPSEFDCDILGDVQMFIYTQKGSAVNFISESTGVFNGCEVKTDTKVLRVLSKNEIRIETLLLSSEKFTVKTKIDRESLWVTEKIGASNVKFELKIKLHTDFGKAADPALPSGYNGEAYTYDDDVYN